MKNKEITVQDVWAYESEGTYRAKGPEGNVEDGAIWAGQVALRLHEQPSCKELIEMIMNEAEDTMRSFTRNYIQ
jgi:NAD(P)H-dependent flavin oxidoreductase YrpB (nitropropane dioxygenase family)